MFPTISLCDYQFWSIYLKTYMNCITSNSKTSEFSRYSSCYYEIHKLFSLKKNKSHHKYNCQKFMRISRFMFKMSVGCSCMRKAFMALSMDFCSKTDQLNRSSSLSCSGIVFLASVAACD